MKTETTPVIAAIPNYNMSVGLGRLLPQVLAQGYDAVYVLDDASTDDSEAVVKAFPGVRWVENTVNTGSGGARNLILEALSEPSVIHFLDADVVIHSENVVKTIQSFDVSGDTGFVGGMVLKPSGEQHALNYGPRLSVQALLGTLLYVSTQPILKRIPLAINRKIFSKRPIARRPAEQVHPYWAIESNLIIYSDSLKKYGPFDPAIREHDIQPIAAKIYNAGLINNFTDEIVVTKINDLNVRDYNRLIALGRAELYVIKNYTGFKKWLKK